ncbi:MAG: hypothetical protein ACOCSE_00270, partial [Chitinivibrionales bacterium]
MKNICIISAVFWAYTGAEPRTEKDSVDTETITETQKENRTGTSAAPTKDSEGAENKADTAQDSGSGTYTLQKEKTANTDALTAPPKEPRTEIPASPTEDSGTEADTLQEEETTDTLTETAEKDLSEITASSDKDSSSSKDSLSDADSLELRKKYSLNNTRFFNMYSTYSDSPDSLFPLYQCSPFFLYKTDDQSISMPLSRFPGYIRTEFTPSSQLNRALLYGMTAPVNSVRFNSSPFRSGENSTRGMDMFSTSGTKRIIHKKTTADFFLDPAQISKPELVFLYDTGPYRKHTLDLRFSRLITEKLRIDLLSNFRHLGGEDFSHDRGNLYGSYKPIYRNLGIDTALLCHDGYMPLSNEHSVTLNSEYNLDNGDLNLSYSYQDLENDIAFIPEYSFDSLSMQRVSQYHHKAEFSIQDVKAGDLSFSLHGKFSKNHRNFRIPEGYDSSYFHGTAGKRFQGGYGAVTYTPEKIQSFTLNLKTTRSVFNSVLDHSKTVHLTKPKVLYSFDLQNPDILIELSTGPVLLNMNDSLENRITWDIYAASSFSLFDINFHAAQRSINPVIPPDNASFSDTTDYFPKGTVLDMYRLYKAEIRLNAKKAGITGGIMYVKGISWRSVYSAWPDSRPPYPNPDLAFFVEPFLGRWNGFSLSSKWVISTEKPFLKSDSHISYLLNSEHNNRHLLFDLGFEYWSPRSKMYREMEEPDYREFYNLYFKNTVQINSFRLFYKIDNIFNRRFTQVPGYYHAGLSFHYGF